MRDDLKQLIDRLPESEFENAEKAILELMAKHDPVLRAFLNAPVDDEPLTEEEERMIAEAYEEVERGEVYPASVVFEGILKKKSCPGR